MEESTEEVVQRMRSYGRSLQDRGFTEDSLEEGNFRWANDFILEKTGWTLSEIQSKLVADVLPERYLAELKERRAGKRSKFFIFPFKTADSRVSWWLARDYGELDSLHWSVAKFLSTTSSTGLDFEVMHSVMESANLAGEILLQHEDHNKWAKDEVGRLDAVDSSLRRDFGDIKLKAGLAEQMARDAVNHSLNTNETLKNFKVQIEGFEKEIRGALTKMEGLEERVTDGIVRLMKTDEFYSRQAAAVRGLTKNIVLSVAAIVAAGVMAQVIASHWDKVVRIFL
jgi:archaellum component FlaC